MNLEEGQLYKFLGILERLKHEEQQSLQCAAKSYLRRMSLIWTSPLSDSNGIIASNTYALPVLAYFMWTLDWPITNCELRIDD